MNQIKKIVNFFFEIAVLKRIPRAGWRDVGIKAPDSVAEHVLLSAQIAYILGKMEKVNAEKAVLIALFHDNGETRIGDINFLTKLAYLNNEKAEEKAFLDQIKELPGKEEIEKIYKKWQEQKTPEAIIAKDADYLEGAIQAKCFIDNGNKLLKLWLKDWENRVQTKSAKKILKVIKETKVDEWWKEIPEIKKEILRE